MARSAPAKVPVISIGSHATASRGPEGDSPIPSAMTVAPVKPPANPAKHVSHGLARIAGLPVDPDRRIHRADEGNHGDEGRSQRRPPRIRAVAPDQNGNENREGNRRQRDPDISGSAVDPVDQRHGQRGKNA